MSRQQSTSESEKIFNNHTMREFLLWLNDPGNVIYNHLMYITLATMGSKENPVGPMWTVQYWYNRNMIIYKNLVELITAKDDRIFVLYGSGHLHLLNHFLRESGRFNMEPDYLSL
ncbi:MAG: DUF5694 domain-containing protein [Bacillota bacterium]